MSLMLICLSNKCDKVWSWLRSNGGGFYEWRWDPERNGFVTSHWREQVLASNICILFTHDGLLLSMTQAVQGDIVGFPLGESVGLGSTTIHYFDRTFGRCTGATLYVTDLPMKAFRVLDGRALGDILLKM